MTDIFDKINARKYTMNHGDFMADLREHLGMEEGPAFDALFAFAWEQGHASGFGDVVAVATAALPLLKAGEKAAEARIRRELLAFLESEKAKIWSPFDIRQLRKAIDRIVPGEG